MQEEGEEVHRIVCVCVCVSLYIGICIVVGGLSIVLMQFGPRAANEP